ncbi:MAG: uroporphyrinogen decarboxylase family protein [Candidatus Freyarchaeota archaeon]
MDARERVLCALNREEPDRVPTFEIGITNDDISEKIMGTSLTKGTLRAAWDMRHRPFWRYFRKRRTMKYSPDLYAKSVLVMSKIGFDSCSLGVLLQFTKCKYPTWDTYIDEYGRKFQLKEYSGTEMGSYVGGGFKSPEDYYAWGTIDPYHPIRERIYKRAQEVAGDRIFIMPGIMGFFESTWEIFGFETFSKLFIQNRKFIERVFEDHKKLAIETAKYMMDLGAEALVLYDDYGHKSGPFISPKDFRKHIYPCLKEFTQTCHKRGAQVLLHSDGNLNQILEDIVKANIDALHPWEPQANMNIIEGKKKYGDQICIVGNVDPMHTLSEAPPDTVREEVLKLLKNVAPGGGYILSSGHSIHPKVKYENLMEMMKTVQKYGKYPIQIPEKQV